MVCAGLAAHYFQSVGTQPENWWASPPRPTGSPGSTEQGADPRAERFPAALLNFLNLVETFGEFEVARYAAVT